MPENGPSVSPPLPPLPHTPPVTGKGGDGAWTGKRYGNPRCDGDWRPLVCGRRCCGFRSVSGPVSAPTSRASRAATPRAGNGRGRPATRRSTRVSRRRGGGGQIRIGGRSHPITPAQEVLLAQSYAAMRRAIQDVRKVDPEWKPPAQAYSTVEGLIAANRAIENEARRHIFERLGTGAGVGPNAWEWMPAPHTNRRLTRAEQREVDRIGRVRGCHRCGRTEPGTPSGSFIGDHQLPKSMGTPTRIYPHCFSCSASQGGLLRQYLKKVPK